MTRALARAALGLIADPALHLLVAAVLIAILSSFLPATDFDLD